MYAQPHLGERNAKPDPAHSRTRALAAHSLLTINLRLKKTPNLRP